ncbi:MAG: YihA family ribosome biogenesis GTP-binding protein [Gammaproteobacteria bacterium]|nr:YihA family ribosome biogenesis GTP-binding protein [Gammaproteobacteria bacterium]
MVTSRKPDVNSPQFPDLKFLSGAHRLDQLPDGEGPEVAIVGRSNAGKSSALNRIASQKNLARTSKTPGRTQQLNVFESPAGLRLVDLPGYGFAKVPEKLRAHFERVIADYLRTRPGLRGVLVVMDSRHPLTVLDQQLVAWCAELNLPLHVLLTKADKLARGAQANALREVRTGLAALHPAATVQLFSSLTPLGVEEARTVISGWWTAA